MRSWVNTNMNVTTVWQHDQTNGDSQCSETKHNAHKFTQLSIASHERHRKQTNGITFVQSSSSKTLLAVKLVAAAVTLLDIGRHHIQGAMFWIGQTDPAVLDGTGAGHASTLSLCQPEFAAFICYAAACAAVACAAV